MKTVDHKLCNAVFFCFFFQTLKSLSRVKLVQTAEKKKLKTTESFIFTLRCTSSFSTALPRLPQKKEAQTAQSKDYDHQSTLRLKGFFSYFYLQIL